MAIWLGDKRVVKDEDLKLYNTTPSSIYAGEYFTWPENTTYTFSNLQLVYSNISGDYISADGSDWAYYKATVHYWRGGIEIKIQDNVTLTLAKQSGEGFYLDGNYIHANNRTTVTGNSRTATFQASFNGTIAGTFTATQQENRITASTWNNPVDLEVEYLTQIPAKGGSVVPDNAYAVQTGVHTYTSHSSANTTNYSFSWVYSYAGGDDFSLKNEYTGEMSAMTRGTTTGATLTSNTITAKAVGQGNKSASTTTTVCQEANYYINTVWSNPFIASFEYDSNNTIGAGGGEIYPSIDVSQSGTTRYTSEATGRTYNTVFAYSYAHTAGDGFTVDSTDGEASAESRGTTTGNTLTSNTITLSITGQSKTATASTTIYQQENRLTATTWNNPVVSLAYASAIGAGGGSVLPTTKSASQSGTLKYTSTATAATSNTAFTWSFSHTSVGRFTLVNSTTGEMSATTKGTSVEGITYSNDITATATGAGSKTGSNKAKASQQANALTATTWNNPSVSQFYYTNSSNISAAGGGCDPVVVASQSGTLKYTSNATASTSNSTFTYTYSKNAGDGFSINSSGHISASSRGTTTGNTLTSNTITVTAKGSDNKTGTKTTTVTQSANAVTATTWNNPTNLEVEYYLEIPAKGGSITPDDVSASQSGTLHYTSNASATTYNYSFTWKYSYSASDGFYLKNADTGEMSASTRGTVTGATLTSSTITAKATGAGSKTASTTTTVCQEQNIVLSTAWGNPYFTTFEYTDSNTIGAGGGEIYVVLDAEQSGKTTYTSEATAKTINSVFTKSFTHTAGDGFTVDTSNGTAEADSRGTTTGNTLTSNTITIYLVANSKTGSTTTKIYQQANAHTATTWNNPVVSLAYATPIGADGGYTLPTTKSAIQSGTKYYTSSSTAATSNTAFTWSFSHTSVGRFSLTDSSSGQMYASSKGTSVEGITYSNDITATATGQGKSGSNKAKASQSANALTATTWNNPVVSTYYYTNSNYISAAGGSCNPVVVASQSGLLHYTSNATANTSNSTFTYSYARTSGDANISVNTSTGAVSASSRGTTTGNTRTTTFTVTAKGSDNKTGTKTATVTQQANTATYHDWTTSFEIEEGWPTDKISCDGMTYWYEVKGYRNYSYYYSYTSTSSSSTQTGSTQVVPSIETSPYADWVSISSNSFKVLANTTTSSDRTANIKATYDGYSDTKSITQWCKEVITYQYSIRGFGVVPSLIQWNQTGTSYAATISGETVYQQIRTKDGVTTTGTTTPYNDTSEYVYLEGEYMNDFYLRDYNSSSISTQLKWYYPSSNGVGYMYIYARYQNTDTVDDKEVNIQYRNSSIVFTQSKKPTISVSPTTKSVSSAYTTGQLTVSCSSADWTCSSNQSWLTVSKSGNYINYTASTNTSSQRSATVTASYQGVSATCVVTQSAGVVITITVSPDTVEWDSMANMAIITVNSNVTGWTASTGTSSSWITTLFKQSETKLNIGCNRNTTRFRKVGTVNITYNGTTYASISCSQDGNGIITPIEL